MISGSLEEAIQEGIRATSAVAVHRSALQVSPMVRASTVELVSTPVELLLTDAISHEAVLRVLLDILLWHRLGEGLGTGLISALSDSWFVSVGNDQASRNVLNMAAGKTAEHPSTFHLSTAAVIAVPDDQITSNPHMRFQRDMFMVGHVAQSMARNVLEPVVVTQISSGWISVLRDQRFTLRAPALNCPKIQVAIDSIPTSGLRGAARLILAAAPAVGHVFSSNWEEFLHKVSGEDTA